MSQPSHREAAAHAAVSSWPQTVTSETVPGGIPAASSVPPAAAVIACTCTQRERTPVRVGVSQRVAPFWKNVDTWGNGTKRK
ncbi:hypothetical protein ACOMHN_000593 [Nucella lapillus]